MPPELIEVGKVVRETEGAGLPADCFGKNGDHCCIAGICRLRGVLGEAVGAFYAVLDKYTLADLVHNRQSLANVLFTEQVMAPPAAGRAA
jgi:Rrf2 family nitric oxide-sensitive transcriptional repressor